MAGMLWGSGDSDTTRPTQLEAAFHNELQDEIQSEVDSHMACAQRVLARHQAEMARMQAMNMKVQVRMLKHSLRTTDWPTRNMVIEIPETF